ncbi:uncharacterized protein [Venturia canescens]|uniref:uncharacterized protein n=1 Tax=Venturia canescens TaxID=32260 RepID=UPI001C9C52B6|nr:uncharacterized protein LOC122417307 [Venturia canescens]
MALPQYFGGTVLGDSNGIEEQSVVPDFLQTFMELGQGNLLLQENVPPVAPPLLNNPSLQSAYDQNYIPTVRSDRPTSDTPETVLSTEPDVLRHLNSVAHKFRTNLKELLMNDLRGQEYLHALTNLGKNNTSLISSILIDSELRNNPDKRIERGKFLDWAHDLVLLVPTTNVDLWYRPYSGTSNGRQCAGGVLYQKYNNKRKTYRTIGVLKRQKKPDSSSKLGVKINPTVSEIENIRWLENNDEPREEVIYKWTLTRTYRLNAIESCITVSEYLDKFKVLKRSDGYILLDMDFDDKYPDSKNKLFIKWARIAEGLLYVAQNSSSPEVLNALQTHHTLITEGKIEVLAFLLLPLLLGSIRTKKKTVNRKPSRVEISELFIVHAETLDDLQPKLQARAQNLISTKTTGQPFPAFIGPIGNLVSSRVIINNVEYDVCSPLKAIDSCFKSFFALDAKYQEETIHCWLFIEMYVYELSRNLKKYACVNKLICALNAYFATHKET